MTTMGFNVRLMQSLFFATQALTVFHWTRICDRVGRKPVILVGLCGLTLSMYCFGLSRTFAESVISRCLSGALNGNIGVIKSMMGELTDASNVARAFAYHPIPWLFGASIGPEIGGALSDTLRREQLLERYPYSLPCAIPALFSVFAWVIVFFFLKETNATGFSTRTFLSKLFQCHSQQPISLLSEADSESQGLPRVLLAILALISLINVAYHMLQPVFYSTPRKLGGLDLPPHAIGTTPTFLGPGNGVFQVACYVKMCKCWSV